MTALRWALGLLAALIIGGVPTAYYRAVYAHQKRLRVVTPGKLYRSGQLTADGLRDAIWKYGIRTVVNLQEENVDPSMPASWLGKPIVRESELCRQLGVNYVALFGGEALPEDQFRAGQRPAVIDQFLHVMDDPANLPVLVHCKAGLHRTGLLTAIYRMEYEHWPVRRAMEELRANGFGTFAATTANVYIVQYVEGYRPGERRPVPPPTVQHFTPKTAAGHEVQR